MAKKRKIPPGIGLGRPHPRDSQDGVIAAIRGGYSVAPDVARQTVLLDAGGVLLEMLPQKARDLAQRIVAAADWADSPPGKETKP